MVMPFSGNLEARRFAGQVDRDDEALGHQRLDGAVHRRDAEPFLMHLRRAMELVDRHRPRGGVQRPVNRVELPRFADSARHLL